MSTDISDSRLRGGDGVGNADVQMSFVFEGSTNSNNGFSGYYFWQIDDLELIETPLNLIEIPNLANLYLFL